MRTTSTAVSSFLPTFREWQEEQAMEGMMRGFVKLSVATSAALTIAKVLLLSM